MLPRANGECFSALLWAVLKPVALTTAAKVATKIIMLLCYDPNCSYQGWRDDEAGLTLQQQQERAVPVVQS